MFYSPLKNHTYRAVWIALFFSNIGTWLHTVTASLLMTKLTTSSTLIALVQTASMLPIFIFAIPAGIIADVYSRRYIIIMSQIGMACLAFSMAFISYFNSMTDIMLLVTTFLLNIGLAFNQPAWQALSSTLVPVQEIKQSAALNNLSFNLSRCIGPALAGFYFSTLGPAYLFALNGLSFLGVVAVFLIKIKADETQNTHQMNFKIAVKDVFFLFHLYPKLKSIISKSFLYFLLASSVWAFLPYVVIIHNQLSDQDLGMLTGAAGIGAVINVYLIFHLRKYFNDMNIATLSIFLTGLVIWLFSMIESTQILLLAMVIFGFSWALSVSIFNGILQSEFPKQIRSRVIGVYCVFFAAAQVGGSFLIGKCIQWIGLQQALMVFYVATFLVGLLYLIKHVIKRDNVLNSEEVS